MKLLPSATALGAAYRKRYAIEHSSPKDAHEREMKLLPSATALGAAYRKRYAIEIALHVFLFADFHQIRNPACCACFPALRAKITHSVGATASQCP
ncbi:MAG: hypothetical protein K6A97_06565 [Lachnospiraceae bacterium]|nr:hypothetical protein [Lachnospiraceae bacterium]